MACACSVGRRGELVRADMSGRAAASLRFVNGQGKLVAWLVGAANLRAMVLLSCY